MPLSKSGKLGRANTTRLTKKKIAKQTRGLAMLRLLSEDKGGGGKKRNARIDGFIVAQKQAPQVATTQKELNAQKAFFSRPNRSDLEGLDNQPLRSPISKRKKVT